MVSAYTASAPPRIGEGVLVPWGLEALPGEVLEVYAGRHAVVAVEIQGASGEVLDTTQVRFRVEELEPLPRWRVRNSKKGRPSPGADAAGAWYVDADRNGDSARVEVRLSGTLGATLASGRTPSGEPADAVRTAGRSAVEKFSYRYRLPRVIVVGTQDVFELRS